jgi:hypothetical protein
MSLTTAIRSILLDRASGYIVLVTIYAVSLPALLAIIRDPLQQRLLLFVLGVATAGLAALFLIDQLPRIVVRLRLVAPLADLSVEARRIFLDPRRAAPILGLALITAVLTVLAADLAGRCVNVHLSFTLWLMIVPPVSLFQLIPLSLGGWGVREAALVVILGKLGIPGETALAASLCVGVSQILVGLPGGLIWLNNWDIGERAPRLEALAATADVSRAAVGEAGSGKRES